MSEYLICTQPIAPTSLRLHCGLTTDQLKTPDGASPRRIDVLTPYLVNGHGTREERHVQQSMTRSRARRVVALAREIGVENVQALSELFGTAQRELASEPSTAALGAGTALYSHRVDNFTQAVGRYQSALLAYRDAARSGANKAAAEAAKESAKHAFDQMQARFQTELSTVKARKFHRQRGSPLTSSTRGLSIARDSRNVTRLNLTGTAEASRLVNFTRYSRALGGGLVAIDFGSRVGNVHNAYQAGGNWERELFIESSSFVASTVAGSQVAAMGSSAVLFLLALTPAGWAGLVLVAGSAAVIGSSAYASVKVNELTKENVGAWHDAVTEWLSR